MRVINHCGVSNSCDFSNPANHRDFHITNSCADVLKYSLCSLQLGMTIGDRPVARACYWRHNNEAHILLFHKHGFCILISVLQHKWFPLQSYVLYFMHFEKPRSEMGVPRSHQTAQGVHGQCLGSQGEAPPLKKFAPNRGKRQIHTLVCKMQTQV